MKEHQAIFFGEKKSNIIIKWDKMQDLIKS